MTSLVRAACVALVIAASVLTPGCTLWWLLNSDPDGLPCRITQKQPQGICLDGYTCVVEEGSPVCRPAGNTAVGELCARSEECVDGAACATGYAACLDTLAKDDINCALDRDEDEEQRCRRTCDITDPTVCAKDERCFSITTVSGVSGICQKGTCASDTECAPQNGLCANAFDVGTTGICLERCDPLTCRVNGAFCSGCDGRDGDADEGLTCTPVPNEQLTSNRYVCDAAGTTPDYAPCGAAGQDLCTFGAFCVNVDVVNYCAPWCSATGGSPGCAAGHTCEPVDGIVGFCL